MPSEVDTAYKPHFSYLHMGMGIEGHERCIPIEQFQKLQELHDNQKKLLAKLQERIQELEQEIKDLTLDKADLQ